MAQAMLHACDVSGNGTTTSLAGHMQRFIPLLEVWEGEAKHARRTLQLFSNAMHIRLSII
jgi:hypothetical protein